MTRLRKEPPQNKTLPASSDTIAGLAYSLWSDRGCPEGSPEQDWHEAERLLSARARARATKPKTKTAGA